MASPKYPISDIYYSIQGEGQLAGTPMVILRFQGCDVGCPWCDTKYTWQILPQNEVATIDAALGDDPKYALMTSEDIIAYIKSNYPQSRWVLITGGEPARHNLSELANALNDARLFTALETSGTETGHLGAGLCYVTISPKIDMPGGMKIKPEAFQEVDEIKFVVASEKDLKKLEQLLVQTSGFRPPDCIISLQPVSTSKKATEICVKEVLNRGWNLSTQMHKYISLR